MSTPAANVALSASPKVAAPVTKGQASAQATHKGSCNGPTGPCALDLGHGGDHVRPVSR